MKKKIAILISVIICLICLPLCGCAEAPTAEEIYSQSIGYVVEVKATSENIGESYGTAEVISADGTLVTNAHVVTYTRLNTVNTFEEYYIRFAYEEEYRQVSLVKFDSEKDLAILKIENAQQLDLKCAKLGNSSNLKAGEKVYAVGNASNYGIGIFQGIVSIPQINVTLDGVTRNVIQSDLTIAAGNSGGALLNGQGELVGITTFRTKDNSGNVIYGIVYSVPVNTVLDFVG